MTVRYYIIVVWNGVEVSIRGPYATDVERDKKAKSLHKESSEVNSFFWLNVPEKSPLEVGSWSGAFFEEET